MSTRALPCLLVTLLAANAAASNDTDTLQKPAPPAPPLSPPYHAPPWPPTTLSAAASPSPAADADCTKPGGNCWNTLCCQQPATAPVYGCFKRHGKSFAQCRPKFGWLNHTERLSGTCVGGKDDAWVCPENWLTEARPQRKAPKARSTLPSSHVVVAEGFWDYSCTDEYGDCTGSECCANPEFGCYKRSGRHYAQCRPLKPNCVDYDWLCPGWERCAQSHGDCTSSLCCRDAGNACHRRPHFYYAQCRDEKASCTPWQEKRTVEEKGDTWLCPGWEVCSKRYEECTLSRCCADPADACYLNKTSGTERSQWYAECRPKPIDNTTTATGPHFELGGDASGGANGGGAAHADDSACANTPAGWVCPGKWMGWRDVLLHDVEPLVASHPGGVAAGVLVLLGACAAVCACCVVQRRRVRTAVRKAQAEIEEMQVQSEIKRAKNTTEGEGLTAAE